jgi:hypothetical protein
MKAKYSKQTLIPVPFCPPKTQHGEACNQTWATTVRSWQMNGWAMTQPNFTILTKFGKGSNHENHHLTVSDLLIFCRH